MKRPRWSLPRVDVKCERCKKPLQRAAAVSMNGHFYHPHPCFGLSLKDMRAQMDLAIDGRK
jgi:hypothetical protein